MGLTAARLAGYALGIDDPRPAPRAPLPESVQRLITAGLVPAELRLDRWRGPTLFTSELTAAGALRLEAFLPRAGAGAEGEDEDDPIVLGSMREPEGFDDEPPAAWAVFCLAPTTEQVILVDLETRERRFVSSGPAELFKGLALFAREWATYQKLKADEADAFLSWLKSALEGVDPRAFRDRRDYWSSWLKLLAERAAR